MLVDLSSIKTLDLIQEEIDKISYVKTRLEIWSNIKLDNNMFFKLSCLIQENVNERFDWKDTVIARDIGNNFFKLQLISDLNNQSNKIIIEIKSKENDQLDLLINQFMDKIEYLFEFYPGIMLFIDTK
jgi:hypothetical protein